MANLEGLLRLLHDGRISFGDFVRDSRGEFRALAKSLLRRWPSPEWLTEEDVEQELYLEAWRRVWDFDEQRCASMKRFIVYSAMSQAKREVHRARGVSLSGSPDKRESCFELTASSLGEPGDGQAVLDAVAEPAVAEDALICAEECRAAAELALEACRTDGETTAVLAVYDAGSLDNAWRMLYDDPSERARLGVESEEGADRYVRRHAAAVARRVRGARQHELTACAE